MDATVSESPIISNFRKYAAIMKDAQDKYERIFKARRDITIESKRIIFLLHSIDSESKKENICQLAQKRLESLMSKEYVTIQKELEGEDPFVYYRAISPGNQEFVEALTFLEYLQEGTIKGVASCNQLPFMPTADYILGIADLTGELMRRCISNIGTGDVSSVIGITQFLREVLIGMIGVAHGRDLNFKLSTLEASVQKVERISYNLQLLGNATPKRMLALDEECDEGLG